MKGQMNLFAGYGEEVCMPLVDLDKKEEKKEEKCQIMASGKKRKYSIEKVQELYRKAIEIVREEGFPLEPLGQLPQAVKACGL